MAIQIPNYQDRIVAFIDILGFKNLVRSLPENQELFKKLNYALHRIKYVEISSKDDISNTLKRGQYPFLKNISETKKGY